MLSDAGDYLALFFAELDRKFEQFVRFFHFFRRNNLCDAQFDLAEIIDGDFFDFLFLNNGCALLVGR